MGAALRALRGIRNQGRIRGIHGVPDAHRLHARRDRPRHPDRRLAGSGSRRLESHRETRRRLHAPDGAALQPLPGRSHRALGPRRGVAPRRALGMRCRGVFRNRSAGMDRAAAHDGSRGVRRADRPGAQPHPPARSGAGPPRRAPPGAEGRGFPDRAHLRLLAVRRVRQSSASAAGSRIRPEAKAMPFINGMLVQSDGSRPHVVYIMKVLAETFPNVIWKIGGKVPRTTAGGGFSAHSVGRACDIYLDANERLDKKLGDLLFNLFITEAVPLKVDHTIWDTRWSDDGAAPTTYTGSGGPHKNHVHVAFKDDRLNDAPLVFVRMCASVVAPYS